MNFYFHCLYRNWSQSTSPWSKWSTRYIFTRIGTCFIIYIIPFIHLKPHNYWIYCCFVAPVGWIEEQKKFCSRCSTYYDTIEAAKTACEEDLNCNAVYDLFCDGIGRFCTCRYSRMKDQTHPKGLDCIHRYYRP